MGEHLPCKQGVKGSNPFISTQQVLLVEICSLKTEYWNIKSIISTKYGTPSSDIYKWIDENSTWKDGAGTRAGDKLPPLPLYNSPIPDAVKERGEIAIPGYSSSVLTGYSETTEGRDNAMYNLYKVDFENGIHPFDTSTW